MLAIFRIPRPVRTVKLTALAGIIAAAIVFGVTQLLVTSAQWTVTSILQNKAAASPVPTTAAAIALGARQSPVPGCTRLDFDGPTQVELDGDNEGLTVQNDGLVQYPIFGNAASDLIKQIQHCAPGGNGSSSAEFTAETYYHLSWQYYVVQTSDTCNLTDIKVGLRTAATMPSWQPTSAATDGLASRWQTFIANLSTHEQGHATIDQQYANKLLTDMQAIGNQPCDQMTSAISTVTTADTAALNQANNAYDADTDHGATQGAILPTY